MTMPVASDEMPVRLWTRAEYDHMTASGVFGPEERVELIEGEILCPHKRSNSEIGAAIVIPRVLRDIFGDEALAEVRTPVGLGDMSEPEPDIMAITGPVRRYLARKPGPDDVLLLVEISESTLAFDRGRKASLYARHGIAEYRIVNLVDTCVEIRRDPDPEIGYRTIHIAKPGDTIEPLATAGKSVAVSDLLP